MLDVSALDAFIAGLSTAFFGALVASGAYLLKHHLDLRERFESLSGRFDRFERLHRVALGLLAPFDPRALTMDLAELYEVGAFAAGYFRLVDVAEGRARIVDVES